MLVSSFVFRIELYFVGYFVFCVLNELVSDEWRKDVLGGIGFIFLSEKVIG